jgi:hypothetical protein
MNAEPPFYRLDSYPPQVDGTSVMTRILDALGFRFRWATEGLTEQDYAFQAGQGSQSIAQLVEHIWSLINWVTETVSGQSAQRPATPTGLRDHTLQMLYRLREHMDALDDQALAAITIRNLPVWHILNGPLADALTHVGQINLLRRLAGNPTPKINVFRGTAPDGDRP